MKRKENSHLKSSNMLSNGHQYQKTPVQANRRMSKMARAGIGCSPRNQQSHICELMKPQLFFRWPPPPIKSPNSSYRALTKVKGERLCCYAWFLMIVVFHCQQYQPQMFLDNLTSSMQSVATANTSTALMPSASSHYDTMSHTTASVHEAQVITRGRTDGSISDIISLDWATVLSDPHSLLR